MISLSSLFNVWSDLDYGRTPRKQVQLFGSAFHTTKVQNQCLEANPYSCLKNLGEVIGSIYFGSCISSGGRLSDEVFSRTQKVRLKFTISRHSWYRHDTRSFAKCSVCATIVRSILPHCSEIWPLRSDVRTYCNSNTVTIIILVECDGIFWVTLGERRMPHCHCSLFFSEFEFYHSFFMIFLLNFNVLCRSVCFLVRIDPMQSLCSSNSHWALDLWVSVIISSAAGIGDLGSCFLHCTRAQST